MAYEDIVVSLPPDPEQVVQIWTDGGCRPNPGPGGWAAILTFRDVVKDLSGAEAVTTNNRMELTAAAMGLESLKRPCHVIVHTDSQYLRNGITRWIAGWVRKNWRGSTGEAVANIDLWKRILAAQEVHRVEWRWVRGHEGNDLNERADQLATEARRAAFGDG
ncbi:ribonuclease HI [Rhodopila sp.]|uniref:ribonuclease HI n=1 Tax=Rhodopila sp. TaxID=2480087 RepID=UPI003D1248E3